MQTPPLLSRQTRFEYELIRKNQFAYVSIYGPEWRNGDADVVALCDATLQSTSVKRISFRYPGLLMDSALSNRSPYVTATSIASLSTCVAGCESLEEIWLSGRNARSLFPSVAANDRIRTVSIDDCQAEAAELAELIRTSVGIEQLKLRVMPQSTDYSEYSADGIESVAAACLHNQSIKNLSLDGFGAIPLGNTLLSNLRDKLTTLELCRSCDGTAVASFLSNSHLLRTLRLDSLALTQVDYLAIRDGLSQNSSLQKLWFCGFVKHMDEGDMIRAASSVACVNFIAWTGNKQAWDSIFAGLAHHSNIRSTNLYSPPAIDFAPRVANLFESNNRLRSVNLGMVYNEGVDDVARGLAATSSLVDLGIELSQDMRLDSFQLLFDQGLSQCPTLESLRLRMFHVDTRLLALLVEKNRTLRSLHLGLHARAVDQRRLAVAALVDSMACNDVLEEFKLECESFCAGRKVASSLSSALPKLWKLKTLDIGPIRLRDESDSVVRQLALNMSLPNFVVCQYQADEGFKVFSGRIERIVERNRALHASDYGQRAAPSLWPAIINLALRNEHVGPSMVYRLLSMRSGVVASYVPKVNVRPAVDDPGDDGASECGVARRRISKCSD